MNNYDDLFTAGGEKNETKSERSYNKEEWAAKKQQERTDAFELLDTATKEAVENCETFRDYLLVQSRFGRYSVSNFTIPKLEDFTYEWFKLTIPLLEKNDVRDDGKRFISSTIDAKDLIVETTSGSEGKPMKCYKSQNEKLRFAMDLWEYRKKLIPDLSPKDKFVHFYVARRQKGDFLTLPIIYEKNILHLSLFDLSLKTLFDYWDEILKFKPRWMHGVTSTLYSLACVIKEYNLPRYSFDLVELTGEFLDEDKKKLMEDVFGCIIANQYGAREFWTIAYGCDNSKLHVNENSVFLEEVFNKQG